jgi:hypothetical protein
MEDIEKQMQDMAQQGEPAEAQSRSLEQEK